MSALSATRRERLGREMHDREYVNIVEMDENGVKEFTVALQVDNHIAIHFARCGTARKAQRVRMALEIADKMGFSDLSEFGVPDEKK